MPTLLDLPNELLEEILDCIAPNDLDNFFLSCKRLRKLASFEVLHTHLMGKVQLKRIENGGGNSAPYEFPELLDVFLLAPSVADYVKEMSLKHWKVCWDDPPEEDEFEWGSYWGGEEDTTSDKHLPYPDPMMRAFEEAVNNNKAIPSDEKELWVSKLQAGDQNPVVALLFPLLHYLTRLVIVLNDREDFFMLKALQRIAKDPSSTSLSRLREVEISGTTTPTHRLEMAAACAVLPSIISLEAHRLVEGPLDSAGPTFGLAPHSSSVQNLTINDCRSSPNTLFNLIRSVKSLRSLRYTYSGKGTHPSFTWVRAALLPFVSTSLEELTMHRCHSSPDWDRMECSFRSYCSLRVLTIDYGLLMGDKYDTTNKIVTVLPASLEILNLHGCPFYNSGWLQELVNWIVRVKSRKLPRLKELNFEQTSYWCCTASQIREMCAAAAEAGFRMTVTSDAS